MKCNKCIQEPEWQRMPTENRMKSGAFSQAGYTLIVFLTVIGGIRLLADSPVPE